MTSDIRLLKNISSFIQYQGDTDINTCEILWKSNVFTNEELL